MNMNTNYKLITVLIVLSFLILPITSLETLPRAQQGECINISQTCASCSYVNISSISHRDNSTLVQNKGMSSIGNGEWRYEFCDTLLLGRYDVKGQGDIDTIDTSFAVEFEVTPSGEGGVDNIIFYVFVLVFLYVLNLLGFFKRNATVTILGGIGLTFFGLYMISNGIIIYRNDLTLALSYITLFWGGGSSLWAALESFQENM